MDLFEVRLKSGDRIQSRHYHANNQKQAAQRAQKKSNGRIVSVRKVHALDLIGTVKSMGLQDIIGTQPKYSPREGVVFSNTTIGEIVFVEKEKRAERRLIDKKKQISSESET